MKQPFEPNKNKKNEALKSAEKKVREAIAELKKAGASAEHWSEFSSIMYFAESLGNILSCDNNEAGLSPLIKKLTR